MNFEYLNLLALEHANIDILKFLMLYRMINILFFMQQLTETNKINV